MLSPCGLGEHGSTAHGAELGPVAAVAGMALQVVPGHLCRAALVKAGDLLEEAAGGVEELL